MNYDTKLNNLAVEKGCKLTFTVYQNLKEEGYNDTQIRKAFKLAHKELAFFRNSHYAVLDVEDLSKTYCLYRNDELLITGTVDEIAIARGVEPESLRFYRTPTYAKRREGLSRFYLINLYEALEEAK